MIVYYTGTGNSRRAAQLLAHRLQEDLIDAFPYLKNNEKLQYYPFLKLYQEYPLLLLFHGLRQAI